MYYDNIQNMYPKLHPKLMYLHIDTDNVTTTTINELRKTMVEAVDKFKPEKECVKYSLADVMMTNMCYGLMSNNKANLQNQIEDVIFNDPATIIKWKDGTKTVVKCQKEIGDVYSPELGMAMCIIKKMCGNTGNYNEIFKKWLPKDIRNHIRLSKC